jgi:antitoxin component HigA of HigAB toxin-antitoxin module
MSRTGAHLRKDDYLTLVREFPLTRIRSDAEHAAALNESGRLIGLDRKLTAGESQYLDALVILIREYERPHLERRLSVTRGIPVLKHLMAEHHMSQKRLANLLGIGESAASMILSGARDLTKSHISALSKHFRVGVTAFFE